MSPVFWVFLCFPLIKINSRTTFLSTLVIILQHSHHFFKGVFFWKNTQHSGWHFFFHFWSISSLCCSWPMHSSKPFSLEKVYTAGLECLRRRQINKRVSQGLLVQNLISIHIQHVKHTVDPLPTATSLQRPLFFVLVDKKAIHWLLFKGRYTN